MKKIEEILNGVSCMAIAGHVRRTVTASVPAWDFTSIFETIGRRFRQMSILRIHGWNFPIFQAFSEVKTSCEERTTLWSFWMYPARTASACRTASYHQEDDLCIDHHM